MRLSAADEDRVLSSGLRSLCPFGESSGLGLRASPLGAMDGVRAEYGKVDVILVGRRRREALLGKE